MFSKGRKTKVMTPRASLLMKRLARETAARREAERLLEEKADELESHRQELLVQTAQIRRLSVAIDAAEEGIAVTSPEGTFIYMNQAHARMFGYLSTEAMMGKPWSCLYDSDALDQFDREIMPQFFRDGRWVGEAVARATDGTAVFQDLILTALEDGGILCSTRDISQRRLRERETEELRLRLAEAERSADLHFISETATHDIFNLIAAIDATMTLMEYHCDGAEHKKLIASVFDALRQARMVIEQSYPERSVPGPELCDIIDLAPRLCDLMAPMLRPSQAFYRVITSKPLSVIADATLLSRSINNILKNAIESMVDEADVLRLAVRSLPVYRAPTLPFIPVSTLTYGCASKGPLARIIVHDEGEGMSQSVLDCALERFATSKKADRRRGVGLSSVKSLVDSSGGQLAIYSSPGTGTVFVLDLPAVDPVSGEQFLGVTRDVVGNVILVDDDPLALARLEAFFGAEQWEVAGFGKPLEAWAFMEQAPMFPQLLVTDRIMPGMTGDQLAERAKKIRPDLPVIMCSLALDGLVSEAVDASLPKPADHEVLKAILAGLDFRTGRSRS